MDGLIIINKPSGWTSFDVVAKIRNKLGVKKVGHTGTLDPLATGVLVLCLGKATKLAQQITDTSKEYIAEITFGATSTTDDAEGAISQITNNKLQITKIEDALKDFEGEIMQTPPPFSAKKIGGKRAYKLAREGKEVKLEARPVTISEIEILDYKWPKLSLRIACGKGTYIRSIARDLGDKLGVGGYLSALQRTRVGEYKIEQSVTVEKASEENVILI
ncbi:tRNA pseudouridine(55) synthase TruB [Patescibacteria group bacterium]|nr:tRNA pseudouridine(55) synthase TruB [Patescibacteria group bacterium]